MDQAAVESLTIVSLQRMTVGPFETYSIYTLQSKLLDILGQLILPILFALSGLGGKLI